MTQPSNNRSQLPVSSWSSSIPDLSLDGLEDCLPPADPQAPPPLSPTASAVQSLAQPLFNPVNSASNNDVFAVPAPRALVSSVSFNDNQQRPTQAVPNRNKRAASVSSHPAGPLTTQPSLLNRASQSFRPNSNAPMPSLASFTLNRQGSTTTASSSVPSNRNQRAASFSSASPFPPVPTMNPAFHHPLPSTSPSSGGLNLPPIPSNRTLLMSHKLNQKLREFLEEQDRDQQTKRRDFLQYLTLHKGKEEHAALNYRGGPIPKGACVISCYVNDGKIFYSVYSATEAPSPIPFLGHPSDPEFALERILPFKKELEQLLQSMPIPEDVARDRLLERNYLLNWKLRQILNDWFSKQQFPFFFSIVSCSVNDRWELSYEVCKMFCISTSVIQYDPNYFIQNTDAPLYFTRDPKAPLLPRSEIANVHQKKFDELHNEMTAFSEQLQAHELYNEMVDFPQQLQAEERTKAREIIKNLKTYLETCKGIQELIKSESEYLESITGKAQHKLKIVIADETVKIKIFYGGKFSFIEDIPSTVSSEDLNRNAVTQLIRKILTGIEQKKPTLIKQHDEFVAFSEDQSKSILLAKFLQNGEQITFGQLKIRFESEISALPEDIVFNVDPPNYYFYFLSDPSKQFPWEECQLEFAKLGRDPEGKLSILFMSLVYSWREINQTQQEFLIPYRDESKERS